ncbi:hypothetical protein E2C01_013505 [Portunus trituberculatus]|uniref:Uncharacterized protein n=1 Tax=Portunus trituberculatus TaxID=210409 RepID=A0A5B7DHG0_PORTR|nr:hypothetical protein [Portunus trituberculatus]
MLLVYSQPATSEGSRADVSTCYVLLPLPLQVFIHLYEQVKLKRRSCVAERVSRRSKESKVKEGKKKVRKDGQDKTK